MSFSPSYNTPTGEDLVDEALPPTYQQFDISDHLSDTANVTDDGRIEINLNSKLATTLALVTRLPERSEDTCLPPPYVITEWSIPLNIVIQVVGSRGDVQPFVALGQALQRVGHRVRIATHGVFQDFVRRAGLEFFSIGGDPAELMAYMVKNPGLIPELKSIREGEITKKRQMIREIIFGCWQSCIQPTLDSHEPFVADAIIANPPSFAHVHCAQALSIPVHIMFTMPWTATQQFPHPLACLRPSKVGAGMANYLSYSLVQTLTWHGLADVINDFRKSLDLEAVPLTDGAFLSEHLCVPHTYCWSPSLVTRPRDWPDYIDICGFFFRDIPKYKPSEALQDFLLQGDAPVYIGFGSIVVDDPNQLTSILIEAVRLSGVRAIISAGWSKLGRNQAQSTQGVFFLDGDCPHEWLFPRVSAVIHHGGAGTTACGLLNGRPTVVVPFFGDQYFWGDMIAQAGAGPSPIPYRELTPENLSAAISFCLSDAAALAAATIADGMRQENGVAGAVASFHRHLSSEKLSCSIGPKSPAMWTYKKQGSTLQLSDNVVEVLLKHDRIKPKNLRLNTISTYDITNRRWEPTTAILSSLTSTSIDILTAGNSIWKAPLEIRKQAIRASATGELSARDITAMVGSSVMSIPRLYGAIFKGFLLDLPLAATEGLRATPKLYGEEVGAMDAITDWKSGGVAAGKSFTSNLHSSLKEVYTLPATGLEQDGLAGLSKGLSKGLLGFATKTSAAIIGLVAYPAQGLGKSIHTTFHSKTRKIIFEARREQARYRYERNPVGGDVEVAWLAQFDGLVG